MRFYALTPWRLARQVGADLFVLGWIVAWIMIGRWVFALVMSLAGPADPLRDAGRSWTARMSDIADRATGIPLVGQDLQAPFTGAGEAGSDLVRAGDQLESSVRTVAWVVSVISAGTPILLVVLAWGLARGIWIRRASGMMQEVAEPESLQLLALQALVHQPPRHLRQLVPDPVGAYRSGDPEAIRRLADLQLAELGLRIASPGSDSMHTDQASPEGSST